MGSTTFLLGAGFSKPFGGPLVSDLSTVLTDPPSKAIDPLKFELTDLISMVNNYNYDITSDDKLRYNTNSVIDFFIRYKSFLISEYLTEYYCLPSYETVIGQMSKDTLLFESPVKKDFTNPSRKNKIIEIGNFIKSEVSENERFLNLILNCIDYLTLLVFDKIQENISINTVEEPLIVEFLKKTDTKTTILTLNYDNVLEELLSSNEISFSDGFEQGKWDIISKSIFKLILILLLIIESISLRCMGQ